MGVGVGVALGVESARAHLLARRHALPRDHLDHALELDLDHAGILLVHGVSACQSLLLTHHAETVEESDVLLDTQRLVRVRVRVRIRVRVRVRIRVLTCVDSVPETVLGRPRLAASMGHSAE